MEGINLPGMGITEQELFDLTIYSSDIAATVDGMVRSFMKKILSAQIVSLRHSIFVIDDDFLALIWARMSLIYIET